MPFICLKFLGDEPLRKSAKKESSKSKCDYCGKHRLCISVQELAAIVDEPIRSYCCIGEHQPVFHGDSDSPDWVQAGESLEFILQEELGIDFDAAEALIPFLKSLDPACPYDGDEPFYSDEYNYHRRHPSSWEFAEIWQDFSNRIKHKRRYFDDDARRKLADILGAPGSPKADELPVFEIGPGTRVKSICRARRADSMQKAFAICKNPSKELGPPPPEKATAGRMNSAGIAVFYGGLSEDTAIAEVRPYVGSLVVVGEFKLQKSLKVLDLTKIGVGFAGSIFASGYESKASRRRFLEGFHSLIAKPIQPHEEQLEYIPTQAVAEYVSNVLGFDGILYGSAQLGAVPEDDHEPSLFVNMHELSEEELKKHNIVLFGDAAIVEVSGEDISPEANSSVSLQFQKDSLHSVNITMVNYTHERAYIYNPSDLVPEPVSLYLDLF